MDRVIEKKFWNSKRIMIIAGSVALVALIGASIYFSSGKSKLNVVSDRITISEIKEGKFQENIPVDGVVLPVTTIYLDAMEGGRVVGSSRASSKVMATSAPPSGRFR